MEIGRRSWAQPVAASSLAPCRCWPPHHRLFPRPPGRPRCRPRPLPLDALRRLSRHHLSCGPLVELSLLLQSSAIHRDPSLSCTVRGSPALFKGALYPSRRLPHRHWPCPTCGRRLFPSSQTNSSGRVANEDWKGSGTLRRIDGDHFRTRATDSSVTKRQAPPVPIAHLPRSIPITILIRSASTAIPSYCHLQSCCLMD